MVRSGWSKTSIKVGGKVIAIIYPLRDGQKGGMLKQITAMETGKTFSVTIAGENIDRPNIDEPLPAKPEAK
jgi:hypothetical protein